MPFMISGFIGSNTVDGQTLRDPKLDFLASASAQHANHGSLTGSDVHFKAFSLDLHFTLNPKTRTLAPRPYPES